MEQVLKAESITKKHWVLDNDYTSIAYFGENFSKEDVESVIQQIKYDSHELNTLVKKEEQGKTQTIQHIRLSIKVPNMPKRYDILKKKFYTKNNKTWKGVITEIQHPVFKARLYDMDNHSGTYETASFNIKTDITEQDLELVDIGAIFYWSVGNVVKNKTLTKRSEIRMRRLANITVSEFDELHDRLESNYGNIIWDNNDDSAK